MASVPVIVVLPTARTTPAGAAVAPADIARVRVFRSDDGVSFVEVVHADGPFTGPQVSLTDATVPTVTADKSIAYAASVVDTLGQESAKSETVPYTIKAALGAPLAPVILSVG